MSELDRRIARLEKGEGLSKAQRDFLDLPYEERENMRAVTQRVMEAIYKVFIKRHPELKDLRYKILEHPYMERPLVSKLRIGEWLERLSPPQRRMFRVFSCQVSKALILWKK